jgi:hypothetical protein
MSNTYTLLDNLECESLNVSSIYGTDLLFDANNKSITCKAIVLRGSRDEVSVNMGSGTWEAMIFGVWDNWSGKRVNLNPETSTIRMVPSHITGMNGLFRADGGYSFNNIEIAEGTEISMGGDNTFNNFKAVQGAVIDLGESQIDIASLQATGTDSNPINITGGTLSKPSGFVQCDYLVLADSRATGGAKWYAGENSIDNGGNEGWIFRKRKYQLPARKV